MVWGGGLAKCGQVAAKTFGGEPETIELADGSDLMAGVTVHCGVSADQRKSILMLIDVVNGNLPAVGVVTKLTLRAVLAAMQIGVAILTLLRSIAEDQGLVAIGALHFCMAAAQRKLSLRMVELEFGAERLPSLRRMAILTRDLELIAVRAMARVFGYVLPERSARRKDKKKAKKEHEKSPEMRQNVYSLR